MSDTAQVRNILRGDGPQVAVELLPLVYDELRALAAKHLANEQPGQTLDGTALVHEAYVRLVGASPDRPWNGRGHFFAAAAEAMRRILVENARRKRRLRHGGDRKRLPMDEDFLADGAKDERLLAVDEALATLAQQEATAADVVKLRYFAGLTMAQTAEALDISVRTANRHWAYARAWLYRRLS
jgi:RNA polymerase sigma factor (TIGR02999 family)